MQQDSKFGGKEKNKSINCKAKASESQALQIGWYEEERGGIFEC
jgi:hypothetical protein